mgnify:CR=1 FL=1
MKPCRVLVTGAGSGVGQGVVKALRHSDLPVTVICSDIAPLNVALYRADEALILPKVEAPGSLETIIAALKEHRIDVVMIGSEFDLEYFAEHKEVIEERTAAIIAVSPLETVRIADDKWLTAEFLRESGLPYAPAALPKSLDDALKVAAEWGYPLILKPRRDTSSRHVHVIHTPADMESCFPQVPNPMLQELLDMPSAALNNEYTCSVFRTRDGDLLGPFTARRTLRGGTSWHIEVDEFAALHPMLLAVAAKLPFIGSLNVQLIQGDNGPVAFEINSRFSGTTAVRAHFGFNEPDMFLRDYFYGLPVPRPIIGKGVCLRYLDEVFIDDVSADDLTTAIPKGEVHPWF